jgi:hypothetical protein
LKMLAHIDSGWNGSTGDRSKVERLYRQLVQEHRKANAAWRRMGHITLELVKLGESYQEIQRRLKCSKTSLHRWAQIIQAFPSPDDCMLHEAPACMSVLNACVTSARQIEGLTTGRWIPAAREALVLVSRMKSVPSVRKLTATLAKRRRQRIVKADADARKMLTNESEHQVHCRDCVDVAKDLSNASIDLAWLDPCYLRQSTSGMVPLRQAISPLVLTSAANPTAEQSRQVLRRLIPVLSRKMKPTGVVVYWGDARTHDDPHVITLFLRHGWRCVQASLWRKWVSGASPAGNMRTSDAADGERYLVWARRNHVPTIYDSDVGRHGIIDAEPIRASSPRSARFTIAADGILTGSGLRHRGRRHLYEKPIALAERFFRKYLPPRSLVFDPFGCSGSACIAAASLGHRFVYAEIDEENYRYGAARLALHLKHLRNDQHSSRVDGLQATHS